MKVNLRLAEPNPFRDFGVDPIDKTNVSELAKSIKEDGFWGGMVARRRPGARGVIQVLAGWHRREAALKAGIEEADIFVGEFDDESSVRVYARENALQRGNTSTALAGSVAAAVREILLRELTSGDSTRPSRPDKDGVGRDAILKELHDVPGVNENVVKLQLANLKSNGAYDRIVREVTALVEVEREAELEALAEAERRTREAEKRETEAKARREQAEADKRKAKEERDKREAEAKAARDAQAKQRAEKEREAADKRATEAEERRKLAAAEAEKAKAEREAAKARETKHAPARVARDSIIKLREQPQHEVTFNAEVAKYFRNPHHVETFKRLATGGHGRKYLPVEKQGQLAKALAAKAVAEGKELTSKFIEDEFNAALIEPRFVQKIVSEKEREERRDALLREGWQNKMSAYMGDFARHARGALSDAQKLADLNGTRPAGATLLATNEFRTAVDSLKAALRIVEGKLI